MDEHALTVVTRTQGNNRALKNGEIDTGALTLDFVEIPVLVPGFRRMVRDLEFDVCEMAATTYLCAREHGVPFTALPIFLVRGFHHGAVTMRERGAVGHPKDLAGTRVGVSRGYTVTTGVWARGVLADEYGLDLDTVTWMLSGDEHVAAYRPPANVVPMRPGTSLPDMLAAGEITAAIGIDGDHPTLIPDAGEAGYRALTERGHYPINHLVVVRDDVLAERPEVAEQLFAAFTESKRRYVAALGDGSVTEPTAADRTYERVLALTGDDPLPYGIEPNRQVLEELVRHATDQHILHKTPDLDALFAAPTRALVG